MSDKEVIGKYKFDGTNIELSTFDADGDSRSATIQLSGASIESRSSKLYYVMTKLLRNEGFDMKHSNGQVYRQSVPDPQNLWTASDTGKKVKDVTFSQYRIDIAELNGGTYIFKPLDNPKPLGQQIRTFLREMRDIAKDHKETTGNTLPFDAILEELEKRHPPRMKERTFTDSEAMDLARNKVQLGSIKVAIYHALVENDLEGKISGGKPELERIAQAAITAVSKEAGEGKKANPGIVPTISDHKLRTTVRETIHHELEKSGAPDAAGIEDAAMKRFMAEMRTNKAKISQNQR